MERVLRLAGESAMTDFATRVARLDGLGLRVWLRGDLGVGKTTWVRGFLHALGYQGPVKSPTYTLVEHYAIDDHRLFHFDLYRVSDAAELEYMGIRDYFTAGATVLVEWPENGAGILPNPDIEIQIHYDGAGARHLTLNSHTERGTRLMRHLEA